MSSALKKLSLLPGVWNNGGFGNRRPWRAVGRIRELQKYNNIFFISGISYGRSRVYLENRRRKFVNLPPVLKCGVEIITKERWNMFEVYNDCVKLWQEILIKEYIFPNMILKLNSIEINQHSLPEGRLFL
jgi:hypothetical protein